MRSGLRAQSPPPSSRLDRPVQLLWSRRPERLPCAAPPGGLMLHYSHEGLIQRNTILGKVLTFGGLGLLVIALVASLIRPDSIAVILPVSLVGMAMSQAGSIYMTRWNRRGRADLLLDEGLKGLGGRVAACDLL